MKAAICYDFDAPLVVEEVTLDPPQAGEVKVKVAACAICHSDVYLIKGRWGGRPPLVAGHEAAGVVSEVGPGVTRVAVGDHVVVSLLRACGHCFYCTSGRPFNCEAQYPLDRDSRLRNAAGAALGHGLHTAAFAEYTIVDQSQLVKLPKALPLDSASLLACGVITGLGAVANTARVETGSQVAVIGVGGVGLNAVQGALLSGAAMIIAVDVLGSKLDAARGFGATHVINASDTDPVAAVLALSDGRGVDYAFATVGSPSAIAQSVDMVRPGGAAVIAGMPANDEVMIAVNAHHLTYGRRIMGSPMGSTRLTVDVPRLVSLYQHGRLKLDELITARYPIEQINQAIAAMEGGAALRNVIVFD